ncbi:MAG: efflux RND transporter permease subunit [Bacteroidota bacterium]
MKLPRLSIEYASFTWMVFLLLTFFGVKSYFEMPRTENPEIVVPGASVIIAMPGSGPVDLEKQVAQPLEEALNELEDIIRISTTVNDGIVVTSVEFEFNSDADANYNSLVEKVNSIKSELPDEILRLETWQWKTTDLSMLQLALISDTASYRDMERQAELLKSDLERNSSVKSVDFLALPGQLVKISLDMEKMAQVNTSLQQVISALQSNNANIPGGEVRIGDKSLNVRSSGAFLNLDEIRNTVVNNYQGRLIYLENIASVHYDYEEVTYLARFGGDYSDSVRYPARRAVFITVNQKEGRNVLKTAAELKPVIRRFEEQLDPAMKVEIAYDQSERVKERISGFISNLLQGIVLVGLVIFLSLGVRSSLVVVIAIPLSIIIGLGIVDMSGFGLQQVSIAALVVALGLLVDNSIVMVENINRFLRLGHKRKEASILAASEIGWPVVTATLTTVLAFIPLAAMPDKAGAFIKSLPITIMGTLSVSLLIALTLTPLITSRLFREPQPGVQQEKGVQRLLKWIIENPFRKTIIFALGHKRLVILLSVGILLGSVFLARFLGLSFFPKGEQPALMVRINLPEGSNLQETDKAARFVGSVLDTTSEVRHYTVNVGHGNPQIFYNIIPRRYDLKYAEFYVELRSYQLEAFNDLLERLRKSFSDYPGAKITIKEFEQGPPFEAPVQINVTGKNLDELKRIAADVEAMVKAQPGAVNVENEFIKTRTELFFDINKEKANMLGVPVIEIDRAIRTAIAGIGVTSFRDAEGKEYRVIVELEKDGEFELGDVNRVYVSSLSGRQIPLSQLVTVRFLQAPSTINRYNFDRTAQILADVKSGYSLDDIMNPVIARLDSYPFPSGYGYKIRGELEGRMQAFGGMLNAIIIAMISIFAVLVLQFRSIRQPLIIFIAIPFAAIGMIWALLITGYTFSFTAFIGLTSLVGIVVNNSIILVDYTNKLRETGLETDEALRTAAETRLTPILLTALTTIGGLLPLTLRGGTLWAPLGWTIIGGLFVSTVLTLVVVPVFYKILSR